MRSWMIFFVAGVASATWQKELIPLFGCISIALVLPGLYFLTRIKHFSVIASFMMGFLYTSLWGHWQLDHRLPHELLRSDWIVSGEVLGIPHNQDGTTRFSLKISKIASLNNQQTSSPPLRKIRLSWFSPSVELEGGEKFTAVVRLKPPHSLLNPEGFDYERWLMVRGIDATGYVREFRSVEATQGFSFSRLRNAINDQIKAQHELHQVRSMLTALITGDKSLLTDEDWVALKESGTVHLAVISGLHIGFMAFVGWWLGRLFGFLCSGTSQRALPYLMAMLLSGLYMMIAGADLPAQRAFIMVSLLMLSGWKLISVSHWDRWWVAMVGVLVFSPLAIWETGFWLSFGAVACLLWCGQAYQMRWQDGLKLQFLLLAGMLPLYLIFFSAFSLVAPLVNLVAIPLVAIVVPLEFIDLLGVGFISPVIEYLVITFWWLVDLSRSFDWAYLEVIDWQLSSLLLLMLAAVVVLLPSGIIPKYVALFLLFPLLLGTDQKTVHEFNAKVFDVGQGLAVLIEIDQYRLLYDTGPSYRNGGNAFERAISPYLRDRGIHHIDHLILSHNDNDHVGGYPAIEKDLRISQLITSFDTFAKHQRCKAGDHWSVGSVNFTFLSGNAGNKDNNRSCVLLVETPACSLLLPGDIESEIEHNLSIKAPVTWLIAAHHGSRTSTSLEFLDKTQPEVIIFSAGYGNAFNHPHPDVVERSRQSGAKVFSTALNGAVLMNSNAENGCETRVIRQDKKRFWRSFQAL
ncbi:MAG: DNA internalization-related competence protein ComEC/Rec2 [Neptuniibacter sp.]